LKQKGWRDSNQHAQFVEDYENARIKTPWSKPVLEKFTSMHSANDWWRTRLPVLGCYRGPMTITPDINK